MLLLGVSRRPGATVQLPITMPSQLSVRPYVGTPWPRLRHISRSCRHGEWLTDVGEIVTSIPDASLASVVVGVATTVILG
jgi:hypothetical protein